MYYYKAFFIIAVFSLVLCVSSDASILVEHKSIDDIVSSWADGDSSSASASGYNNGSIMNPGRHWASTDNFILPGQTESIWNIDRLSFVCGTELDATVSTYRVSIYGQQDGQPQAWDNFLWRYEEVAGSLDAITVNSSLAGGSRYRVLQEIELDTTSLNLQLNGGTTYYVSIEGDCANTENIYEGFDTYYQRFYMLSLVNTATSGQINDTYWYAGEYSSEWNQWQEVGDDLIWTVEGHLVPEPCTALLLAIGGLALIRKKRS